MGIECRSAEFKQRSKAASSRFYSVFLEATGSIRYGE
jgi:hypothetical protein